MKLNLGCGDKKREGFTNVDICGDPDVRCDLSKFPWPFENQSVDEVFSEHFLEHVQDFEKIIYEIHRILKPGGVMHFKVPHFRSAYYPWYLHHYQFSTVTCHLLCEKIPYQFQGKQLFDFSSIRLNYLYLRPFFRKILSFLANISPSSWDYLGLPIDEIECWVKKHTDDIEGRVCPQ